MVDRSPGLFDFDERLAELSAKGDGLERVNALVYFEMFRPTLEAAAPRADRSKGGRPPFDHVLMFKILILQAMHSLSDDALPRTGTGRSCSRRQYDLDVPRGAEKGERGRRVVPKIRRGVARRRLSGDGPRPHQGGPHSRRLRRTRRPSSVRRIATRAGRSNTPRPSRARTRRRGSISPFRRSATRTTSRSTARAG